jgi:hypothetical protein
VTGNGATGNTGTTNTTNTSGVDSAPKAIWALVNLLLAIFAALLIIVRMISTLVRRKGVYREEVYEFTDTEGNTWQSVRQSTQQEFVDEDRPRRIPLLGPILRIIAVLLALGAVILFLLTEDVRNSMVLIDKWTILMALILLVETVAIGVDVLFSGKRRDEEEDEDEVDDGDASGGRGPEPREPVLVTP